MAKSDKPEPRLSDVERAFQMLAKAAVTDAAAWKRKHPTHKSNRK